MKRILILIHVLFCGYICPLLAEDTGAVRYQDDVIAAVVGGHDAGKAPHHTCRVSERGGKAVGLIGAEAPPPGEAQRVERLALVVGSGDHHLTQHDIQGLQLYIEDRLLGRHHGDR